ncbi:hypothetical protein GH714_021698 [Hevea brasiliensis]|uniref:Thymidine kinase n=1 Tax=Hevea brasiliensis TaxID=3981 RepID=A0A6A6KW34_HEVBR|nr:hypothetical protein GH714_021698 [Hevea brasiliensis]
MLFISNAQSLSHHCHRFSFSSIPQISSVHGAFRSSVSLSSIDGKHKTAGEIHVIVGPMFAGKTTSLLRRIKSEGNNGRNVAMIKSSKDTRYAKDSVVTHDGLKFPCWALPDLASFQQKLGDDAYQKVDVIGIDEAQFFEDLYDFCCKAADHDGKTIIIAGLDGDYLRKTAETQTELIGDALYAVCRQHYVNGQVVMEAARNVLESCKVQSESQADTPAAVV